MIEDREQPFAAFVIDTLARRGVELGERWEAQAELTGHGASEPSDDGVPPSRTAERLVRAVLAATSDGEQDEDQSAGAVMKAGSAVGGKARRHNASLHELLEALGLLEAILLEAAEYAAADYPGGGAGRDGLAVAKRISRAMSALRLAATRGYAQAVEEALRGRYRAIRHDLRNLLGTIRSAVALLTDESIPPETRHSPEVRAMVVRNARSLDRMIGEALGNDAARLHAFGAPQEAASQEPANSANSANSPADLSAPPRKQSGRRKQRDDVARER